MLKAASNECPDFIQLLIMERNVGLQQSSLTRGNFCEWHTRWNYKMLVWWILVFLTSVA